MKAAYDFALPPLPEPVVMPEWQTSVDGKWSWKIKGYTADQMRAYGEACARAALAQAEAAQPVEPAPVCPGTENLPPWEDPRVQIVYRLLEDEAAPPDPAFHWEGWVAQRIVGALFAAPQPAEAAPKQEAVALPPVPASVMLHVHAYGDARADDEPSHEYLKAAVLEMRRWAGSLAAQPQQPAPEPVAGGWINVEDRLPEPDSGEVLVWLTLGICALDEWHTHREDPTGMGSLHTLDMGCMWRTFDLEEITHWMPLPAAPQTPATTGDEGPNVRANRDRCGADE